MDLSILQYAINQVPEKSSTLEEMTGSDITQGSANS